MKFLTILIVLLILAFGSFAQCEDDFRIEYKAQFGKNEFIFSPKTDINKMTIIVSSFKPEHVCQDEGVSALRLIDAKGEVIAWISYTSKTKCSGVFYASVDDLKDVAGKLARTPVAQAHFFNKEHSYEISLNGKSAELQNYFKCIAGKL